MSGPKRYIVQIGPYPAVEVMAFDPLGAYRTAADVIEGEVTAHMLVHVTRELP